MVSGSVAELTLHVIAPAIALTGGRGGARMCAARLNDSHCGEVDDANRARSIDRGPITQLPEGVPPPTEDLACRCSGAGVHRSGGHRREIARGIDARRLRAIASPRRQLPVVVASPTVHLSRRRNGAGVLVASGNRHESSVGRGARRKTSVVARAITNLPGVVGAPAIQVASGGDAAGVIPADRHGAEAQPAGHIGGPRAR